MIQDQSANPVINLPAVLDLRAVEPLKAALLEQRGQDLTLDASAVERVGGLGLQLLMSAVKTWQADGKILTFLNVSEAMSEQWLGFGASPTPLVMQDAA